ncbi:MAG: O-antigen ligase family protein [Chloroflexia bacterium]
MAAISATLPRGSTLLQQFGRLGGPSVALIAAVALAYKPTYFVWAAGVPWVLDVYQKVAIGASDIGLLLIALCGIGGRPLPPAGRALKIAGTVLVVCLTLSTSVAEQPLLAFVAVARCWVGLLAALAIARRPGLVPWLLLGGALGLIAQIPFVEIQMITQSTYPSGQIFDGWPNDVSANAPGAAAIIGPDGTRWQRAFGTFPHPNVLGGAVAVALVLALPRMLRDGRPTWPAAALWALGWVMLLLTFSRAALLAAVLGCALYLLGERGFRLRSLGRLLIAPAAGLALTAVFFSSAIFTRLSVGKELIASPAVQERGLIADVAWTMIKHARWRGVGAGNFTLAELHPPFDATSVEPAHAVPLLIAAEAGVLAGLAWFAMLLAPLLVEWFRSRRITIARLAAPTTLLTIALLDHYLWTFGPGRTLFWLALGIWVAGASSGRRKQNPNGLSSPDHDAVTQP